MIRSPHIFPCLLVALVGWSPGALSAQTLRVLIADSLAHHPAMHGQAAKIRGAEAGLTGARSQFFPTPSLSIERGDGQPGERESTGMQLSLTQPLWTGGRLTSQLMMAEADVLVAHAARTQLGEQIALSVIQIYGEWLANHLKLLAHQRSLASHQSLLKMVKRRVEHGAAAESDFVLAAGRLQSVEADVAAARSQAGAALAQLEALVGESLDAAEMGRTITLPQPIARDEATVIQQALAHSPGIAGLEAQARRAEAMLGVRRSAMFPEAYLRAERRFGHGAPPSARGDTRIFVGLRTQFGAGMSNAAEIGRARAERDAALSEIEVRKRALMAQIKADLALLSSMESRTTALGQASDAAGQVEAAYQRQFLAGRRTWLDLMNAARERAQAQAQMVELEASHVVVTWRLAVLAGAVELTHGN
jgi:adhesin transport system outer membrane protein